MLYEQLKHSHQQQDKSSFNISDDESEPLSGSQPVHQSEYEKITKGNMNERIPIANGDNYDEEDDLDHSRHFIAMELEERDTEQLKMQIREQQQHNLPRILRKAPKIAHDQSIAHNNTHKQQQQQISKQKQKKIQIVAGNVH